jgi:hypothetical protein
MNGNTVRPLDLPPSTVATALADYLYFVSKSTIAGAHYGALVALPWVNATLEAPAFTLSENTGTRFGDLMVRPFELGWHARRADITTGIDVYLPTGRYEPGGDDNVGKGMVTCEPYVGTTLFLDEQRSISVATVAFWQINGEKKHTNAKVGQTLPLGDGRTGENARRYAVGYRNVADPEHEAEVGTRIQQEDGILWMCLDQGHGAGSRWCRNS